MSLVVYNSVNLSHSYTESVEHGPVRDPSGVDQVGMDVTVRVRALLAPGTFPSVTGEGPGDTTTRIRHMLCAPRRPFVYYPSGTLGVGNGIQITDGHDHAHGPWPDAKAFRIQRVTEGSYVVTFAVTCRITDCSDWLARGFLSLKWNESTTYDRNQLCTKRRSGHIIISSKSPAAIDSFRGLITPYVPAGFRRDSAEYAITEDGLTCKFTFVDKQLMRVPPWPALKIRGRMAELWPKGGIRRGYLNIRADGPPGVGSFDLLNVCVRIAMSIVFASTPHQTDDDKKRILITGGIDKSLDDEENSVGLTLEWAMKAVRQRAAGQAPAPLPPPPVTTDPTTGNTGGGGDWSNALPTLPPAGNIQNDGGANKAAVPAFGSWLGVDYGDPTQSIVLPIRGRAQARAVGMIASALYDPCGTQLNTSNLSSGGVADVAPSADGSVPAPVPEPTVTTLPASAAFSLGSTPSDQLALYSAEDQPGLYDHYTITARYRDKSGQDVLPGTGVGPTPDVGKVVTMHGAQMTCEVAFSARIFGGPPVIPNGRISDPNMVYKDGMVELDDVELTADGVTEIHSVTGLYKYGVLDPSKVSFTAPLAPFLDIGALRSRAEEVATRTNERIGFPSLGGGNVGAGGDFGPFDEETGGGSGGDFGPGSVNP